MNDLEKMRAGRWLHAVTPEIGAALLRAEELCFRLNQLPPSRREEREAIIRQLFAHVGEAPCLHGAVIELLFPSVGATENVLLAAVGCYELMHAVGRQEWKLLWLMPVIAAWMCTAIGLGEDWTPEPGLYIGICCFIAVVYTFAIAVIGHGRERSLSFRTAMAGLFSATGIAAGFACLVILRGISPAVVLTPFIGAFMSDTGAFFAGRAFGKRKLAPAVSPNKTVAGCIGGFAGSIVGMIIFHLVVKTWFQLDLGWGMILLMGVLGSLFGQLGDLSFSVIKREFGIKDYGTIFPGHGGVLDRFDSVLFVAPAYMLLMFILLP